MVNDKLLKWNRNNAFDAGAGSKHPPVYPHEALVKLTSSSNYSSLTSDVLVRDNLDVGELGCFGGNNLRYFWEKGWKCSGFDVTVDALNLALENLRGAGIHDVDLKLGTNTDIPAADASFDLFVSINTIHYSCGEERRRALREMARVLRPGGVLVLETAGQNHEMVRKADKIAPGKWKWGYDDFRKGDLFGFYDDLEDLQCELGTVFSEVECGSLNENYPRRKLEFYLAVARKGGK